MPPADDDVGVEHSLIIRTDEEMHCATDCACHLCRELESTPYYEPTRTFSKTAQESNFILRETNTIYKSIVLVPGPEEDVFR